MQRYLQRTIGMFLKLQRMDLAFFHSAFCSLGAIFFFCIIYGIIQWESICSHIFPADVWIYYGVPFGMQQVTRHPVPNGRGGNVGEIFSVGA